eukprot:m.84508 g.84508  ORF g.84508 m.84508 type:complete len:407 (-) comp9597_c0_seq3:6673-7893(-)
MGFRMGSHAPLWAPRRCSHNGTTCLRRKGQLVCRAIICLSVAHAHYQDVEGAVMARHRGVASPQSRSIPPLSECCSSCQTTGFLPCPALTTSRHSNLFNGLTTCPFDDMSNAATTAHTVARRSMAPGVNMTTGCHGPTYPGHPDQHIYLSVLSPGHVGSSALAGLLATSPAVSTLCSAKVWQCEGEKILMRSPNAHVPPLLSKQRRNAMARGDTIYAVTSGSNDTRRVEDMPWGAVYHMYQTYWNLSKPILLDKSPAFLAYGPQIARALQAHGRRAAFIVLSRSPCTMSTKRRDKFESNLRNRSMLAPPRLPNPQLHNYNRTAAMLIATARALRQAGHRVIHVRYEDLVLNPYGTVARLLAFLPELQRLDPTQNGMAGYNVHFTCLYLSFCLLHFFSPFFLIVRCR